MTQARVSGRALSAGIATAALLLALAGSAEAQQAYYFPQAGNGPVTINYGALTPYAAPGYQPYGAPAYGAPTSQPRSVFTPQATAPAYPAPAYGVPAYTAPAYTPVYAAPNSRFLPGQVTGGSAGQPAALNPITYNAPVAQPPFVAPYANPYAAQMAGQMNMHGLPGSTPQSYLNVPGQAPVALMGVPQPGAKPFDPNSLKRKSSRKAAAATDIAAASAVEEAAAAQVAAVEAQLESGPTPSAALPEPTPPAAPEEIPANVPSPAATAEGSAAAVAPAQPVASSETVPADTATIEPPAEDASGETQTAAVEPEPAAEAAAEPVADTGGAAALPGGATRIVFEAGADDLPAGASADLDALAQRMMSDESIKVQVLAYSSSIGDNESQARRKALSRGLEVRKYLIGKGVRSNRIDVRALGSKSEGNPADRVDIVPAAG